MNILTNDAMRLRRSERYVARHLRLCDLLGAKAEGRGIGVAWLYFELTPVDGAAVQTWRSSGLEPASAQSEQLEGFTQKLGGWFAAASGRIGLLATMNESVEKSSGRDDDSLCADSAAIAQFDAARGVLFQNQLRDFRLLHYKVRLAFQYLAHLHAILLFVALRARRPYRRSAGGIEQSELYANGVGNFAHDAAERVNFAYEVSFGDPANCRVTRHLRDQVGVERKQGGLQAHAGRGHGSLAAGVSGAYYDHIVLFDELRHWRRLPFYREHQGLLKLKDHLADNPGE